MENLCLVLKSMFSVKIYDKTNCEKDIGPAKMNNDNPSFCTEIGNQNQVRDEIEDSSPLIFKAGSERKLITSVQDYCKRGSEREKPHDKKDDNAEGSKWEAWPAKISLAADGCMSLSNGWLDVSTPALKVYYRKRDEKGRESTHQGTTVVGKEKLEIFPIGNAT